MTALIILLSLLNPGPPPVASQEAHDSIPAVSDLAVETIDGTTVALSFTEVADSRGLPANYDVRFQKAPLSSLAAANVTYGSCAGRLTGSGIGSERGCSVANLSRETTYEFQVMAFRGDLSSPGDERSFSNVVAATTSPPDTTPTMAVSSGGFITRHMFTEALEDGWHFRNNAPTLKNFEHGELAGDGYGQANYPTSLRPGVGPIQLRRSWDVGLEELTVSMRWQVSPNMDLETGPGSDAKKIWFLESPLTNPIYLALTARDEIAFKTQRTAEPRDGAARIQGGRVEPGRIYDLKVYVKLNSVSEAGNSRPDGIATVWLDGQRIIHKTDLRFRGDDSPQRRTGKYFRPEDGITGIRWNPTWPKGGGSPREPMWERLYEITVSRGPDG